MKYKVKFQKQEVYFKSNQTHAVIFKLEGADTYRNFISFENAKKYGKSMNTKPKGRMAKFMTNFKKRSFIIIDRKGEPVYSETY